MNLKIILLYTVILTSIINGYGQNKELVLKNKITEKEKIISEGKRIKVIFNSGRVIKGKFIINDTSRLKGNNEILITIHTSDNIYKENVNINSIASIKVTSLTRNIIGGIITGIGMAPVVYGVAAMSSSAAQNPDAGALIVAEGLIVTLGGTLITVIGITTWTGGKYYNRDDWEFSIQTK